MALIFSFCGNFFFLFREEDNLEKGKHKISPKSGDFVLLTINERSEMKRRNEDRGKILLLENCLTRDLEKFC